MYRHRRNNNKKIKNNNILFEMIYTPQCLFCVRPIFKNNKFKFCFQNQTHRFDNRLRQSNFNSNTNRWRQGEYNENIDSKNRFIEMQNKCIMNKMQYARSKNNMSFTNF